MFLQAIVQRGYSRLVCQATVVVGRGNVDAVHGHMIESDVAPTVFGDVYFYEHFGIVNAAVAKSFGSA